MHFKILIHLLAVPTLIIIATGCDRQTRYDLLTTVFTGVPPMEELYGANLPEEKTKQDVSTKKSQPILYQHPLWAARQCTACHAADAEVELNMVEGKNSKQQDSNLTDGKIPGLIRPANKLCINCHRDKTARRAIRERLWLHNPVAHGECLSCHSEHQSYNQAHLQQSLHKICSSCHMPDQLPRQCLGDDNPTENNCFDCHNAHMGRNRFLLSRDYNEVKIPAGPIPEPVTPWSAPLPE